MNGDVELKVDAVGADVRKDALQALVLDVLLVLPRVVLLDHDRDRDAQEDDGKLNDVMEGAAHPAFLLLGHGGKVVRSANIKAD